MSFLTRKAFHFHFARGTVASKWTSCVEATTYTTASFHNFRHIFVKNSFPKRTTMSKIITMVKKIIKSMLESTFFYLQKTKRLEQTWMRVSHWKRASCSTRSEALPLPPMNDIIDRSLISVCLHCFSYFGKRHAPVSNAAERQMWTQAGWLLIFGR